MRNYIKSNHKSIGTTVWKGLLVCLAMTMSGCFKDFKDDYLFTEFRIEFDLASWESKAPGKTYPVDGPVEKGSGIRQYKVNLLGEQRPTDQTFTYRVDPEGTTAQEGVHFRLADAGQATFKANESEAFVSVEILDFPAEQGVDTIVLELVESDGVKISKNYSKVGIAITLTGPPSGDAPLHSQLGPDQYYSSIYVDPLNQDLPADVRQRIQQSADNLAAFADGTRRLQNFYFYFDTDDMVRVVATYNGGGGNSLTAFAPAIWNYKMVLNESGVGKLEFVDANGNGNSQKANFAPILDNYLETYTFKVDWYEEGTALTTAHKDKWGGLFRVDDPSSFLIGSLEALTATGNIKPFPQAQTVHDMFTDGAGGYFTGLVIDPLEDAQSDAFKAIWNAAYSHIQGLAGRKLHKLMFYFNPDANFQDIRVVNYYFSAADGKFIGQVRSQFKVGTDGVVRPFEFTYQDANGGAVRAPQLFDDFFFKESFVMSRNGLRVRFTQVDDPTVYFEGELGNHPLSVTQFWP